MEQLTDSELDRKAGVTETAAGANTAGDEPKQDDGPEGLSSQLWDTYPKFEGDLPEIDLDLEPTPDDHRIFLKGEPIGEDGDLIAITARLKSFKTTVCNAIAASISAGDETDTLGFTMKAEGVFIIFDTEQSPKEILVQSRAIRKRLGVTVTPNRIKVIALREYLPAIRCQIIKETIERYHDSGIAVLVVDGGTDLLGNVNDPEESSAIINFLTVAASRAEAPLFAAVHLNHSDHEGAGGGRGHFGKELERKAKTVLCIEKDSLGVGTIYAATTRGKPIPKSEGQRIAFDEEAGMVVSIQGTLGEAKRAEKKEEWTRLLYDIQAKTGMLAWKHSVLSKEIAEAENVSVKTGKNRIKQLLETGILKHDSATGNYLSMLPRENAAIDPEAAPEEGSSHLGKEGKTGENGQLFPDANR